MSRLLLSSTGRWCHWWLAVDAELGKLWLEAREATACSLRSRARVSNVYNLGGLI